jgi:hypothetical protein
MGCSSSKVSPYPTIHVTQEQFLSYKAAGIVFKNSTHILAGYQPNKKQPCISGFGGMRKGSEMYAETAWRETLEEMFGLETIPDTVLQRIYSELPSKCIMHTQGYIFIVYSFKDLEILLKLVRQLKLPQTIYATYPRTVNDLIFSRLNRPSNEVGQLALLPLVPHVYKTSLVSKDFVQDIVLLCELK